MTKCDKTSAADFHHQIHGKTRISPVNLGMVEPEHGGFEVKPTRNGLLLTQVPSYGSMENVSVFRQTQPRMAAAYFTFPDSITNR